MTEINLRDWPGPGAADAHAWAEAVARARYERTIDAGRLVRGQPPSFENDLAGMYGETAVAIYFGARLEDVPMSAERRRGYDVAGYQVRATRYANGGLRLNRGETSGRYLLAITQYAKRDGIVRLAGWTSAEHGRAVGVEQRTGGREPWIRVDQADLFPLADRGEPLDPAIVRGIERVTGEKYLGSGRWTAEKDRLWLAGGYSVLTERGDR